MSKDLVVVAAGTGEPRDVTIEPGTTAQDVLRKLDLEGYALAKDEECTSFFPPLENIFPSVPDGGKLFASTQPKVGQEGFGLPALPHKTRW